MGNTPKTRSRGALYAPNRCPKCRHASGHWATCNDHPENIAIRRGGMLVEHTPVELPVPPKESGEWDNRCVRCGEAGVVKGHSGCPMEKYDDMPVRPLTQGERAALDKMGDHLSKSFEGRKAVKHDDLMGLEGTTITGEEPTVSSDKLGQYYSDLVTPSGRIEQEPPAPASLVSVAPAMLVQFRQMMENPRTEAVGAAALQHFMDMLDRHEKRELLPVPTGPPLSPEDMHFDDRGMFSPYLGGERKEEDLPKMILNTYTSTPIFDENQLSNYMRVSMFGNEHGDTLSNWWTPQRVPPGETWDVSAVTIDAIPELPEGLLLNTVFQLEHCNQYIVHETLNRSLPRRIELIEPLHIEQRNDVIGGMFTVLHERDALLLAGKRLRVTFHGTKTVKPMR